MVFPLGGLLKFSVSRRLLPLSLVMGFLILGCAHKAAPLTKDRINPSLQNVSALNSNQVMLSFSEELDTVALRVQDIKISSDIESLDVITIYPVHSASEIMVITGTQKDMSYEISGQVLDKSGREGVFRKKFNGSLKQDTIAPWPSSYIKGSPHTSFALVFSEAMDTTSAEYFIIPKRAFVQRWLNWRSLMLIPDSGSDSLGYDTTYYLFLKKISDLNNNTFGPLITSITTDTSFKPMLLKGTAHVNDTMLNKGIAVLERGEPVAISLISHGEFSFAVRDSLDHLVRIIAAGYRGLDSVSLKRDNLIILEPGEYLLDSIIK